jgi:hypothetical protein
VSTRLNLSTIESEMPGASALRQDTGLKSEPLTDVEHPTFTITPANVLNAAVTEVTGVDGGLTCFIVTSSFASPDPHSILWGCLIFLWLARPGAR